MNGSKPVQYTLFGIFSIVGSVRIADRCGICSVALLVLAGVLFIAAVMSQIRKKKKIDKIKDR